MVRSAFAHRILSPHREVRAGIGFRATLGSLELEDIQVGMSVGRCPEPPTIALWRWDAGAVESTRDAAAMGLPQPESWMPFVSAYAASNAPAGLKKLTDLIGHTVPLCCHICTFVNNNDHSRMPVCA